MPFKIISIGDYMTGENAHHFKRGIPHKFRNNYRSLISDNVREVLSAGDLLFLNFESALADERILKRLPINKAVYVAPLETISLLRSLDIPIIANIANNHFAQHGSKVAGYTIEQLEKNDIIVIGRNNRPATISKSGWNIKAWGVSLVADTVGSQSYFKSTYENLLNEIYLPEKEENEIWVLSIHWGKEYHSIPDEKQKELASILAMSGFDLILGHHPHILQTVEKINECWVIYSHGNFLFDQNFSSLTQKGLISKFTMPSKYLELYITKQKNYSVLEIKPVTKDELVRFCKQIHSEYNPIRMRFQMKTEMITHFYQLNLPTLKMFAGRLLSK